LGGNEAARVNITYRFPISDNLDFRLAHMYFDKLYGSFFFDYGNAWMSKTSMKDFKKDLGFELRLETFSFYMYPTRIFVSSAYGLDDFSNVYNKKTIYFGRDLKLYLGILFGFDLFDIN
jgi:outer membrane translocation and assembly module TamA